MTRRRWPLALACVAAVLILADAVLWFAAERALAAGFARWAASMAAQGVVVTAGPAARGGFPLTASLRFALGLRAGAAELRSRQVELTLSPTRPDRLLVRLPAPVALSLPWLPPVSLQSPDWRLAVPLDGSGLVAADARDLSMSFAGPGGVMRQGAAALLHLQAQPAEASFDLVGSAQSIVLPEPLPGEALPLGRHLASVAFEAVLAGRLPPPAQMPARTPAGAAGAWPDAAALASWRDRGGVIEVRRLALGYGPLGISGDGRLGLDAQLQPQGRATLTVLGYAETLDALVAARVLDAHAAQAAGAVLSLLARPPQGGGAPEVVLGVSLRDRVLTAAGFPLLRLPALDWSTAGPNGGA